MSSFTFILHVPDCFYGFCRLRILHISRPQIKATLEQTPHQEIEKNAHESRGFYTRLYASLIFSGMNYACLWVRLCLSQTG